MAGRVGPPLPGVTEVDIDGLVTVYAPTTARVLVLNETASHVWRLADGSRDVTGVTAVLAGLYDTTPEEISADVRAAVHSFVDAGLIAGDS